MPNLNRPFFLIIGATLLLCIGITIGKFVTNFPLIEFEKKIDIVDVSNFVLAIITLMVAIYIAHVLDRKKKKEEYSFEFCTKKIDDLKLELKSLVVGISKDEIPIHIVNSKLKNISIAYLDLKEIMSFMDMIVSKNDDEEIMKFLHHLKRLCTEIPVYKFGTRTIAYTDEKEIHIENGNLRFSPSRIDRVRQYTQKIINKVFYLVTK